MKTLQSMRNHFTVQVSVQPRDDFRDRGPHWDDVCDIWGHISTINERQRVQNLLAERVVTHRITTRYDPRIPETWETMRLLDQNTGRAFNVIGHTNVDERDEKMEFETAEARV